MQVLLIFFITGRWNNQITTEKLLNFIIAPGTAHAVKPSGEDEMPYPNLKISVINAEGYANLSAGLAKVAVRYFKISRRKKRREIISLSSSFYFLTLEINEKKVYINFHSFYVLFSL